MRKSEASNEETDITTKRSLKSKKSSKKEKKKKLKKNKKSESDINESKEVSELERSYDNREDTEECLSHLETFYNSLTNIDLDNLITKKNLKFFQNLNPNANIEIDLYLIKIYGKIFSSDDFYNNYFLDEEENEKKLPLIFEMIDDAIDIIDDFSDYFISLENFKLKQNLLQLIKYIYVNLKEDITDEEEAHLSQLITELPSKFYSENYLEIIKFKNIIYKNNNELLKNIEDIDNLFFELGSYYEQLDCIESLFNDIETEEGENKKNFSSVSIKDIKKKKHKKKKSRKRDSDDEDEDEDDDDDDEDEEDTKENKVSTKKKKKVEYTDEEVILYGQFLLKICIYQKFHLKSFETPTKKKSRKKRYTEDENEQEEEEEEEEQEEEEEDEEEEEEEKNKKNKRNKNKKNVSNKKVENKKVTKRKKGKEEKEDKEDIEDNEEESEDDDDPDKVLTLFVIDAVKNVNRRIQNKSNENIEIEELLENKICISLHERNNLFEIIKKNVENFNKLTNKSKNHTIKTLKEKLSLYISSINNDKYIPINIEKINSIKYYNNFSKNSIIVPNRDNKILYIENNEDQKGLLFVEFYLTEENKDIIFRINRYDRATDDFKQVYDTGKINKKCKLCVYFEEKSLYQIEFDNKYSWINSKEVNFTISLFKITDEKMIKKNNNIINRNNNEENNKNNNEENNNNKNEEVKENIINENNDINTNNENNNRDEQNEENKNENVEEKEKEKEKEEEDKEKKPKDFKISEAILNNKKTIKFYCNYDNRNYTFNCNKIYKRIHDYKELEKNNLIQNKENTISLLIYLNKIRIIKYDNNDKITYTELIDEKEKLISKSFFNKTIMKYLNDNYKIEENNNNNKILINLYCQNKDLSLLSSKIKDLINALKDYTINNVDENQNKIYAQFLQKLGFYPDKKIGEYQIMYNLYDFSDQCLIYHLFLNHCQENFVESSTLVMIFDKDTLHVTAMNEGGIFTKFKALENNWKHKYYSKLKVDDYQNIVGFISKMSDHFDGLDLVLCYMDNEDKKDDLLDLFKQIQEYVTEKIDEPINVYIYQEEKFILKIFKYIGLFSNE